MAVEDSEGNLRLFRRSIIGRGWSRSSGDIQKSIKKLKNEGAQVLGTGEAKIGAHGKPVVFLHPKEFNGTLIELEEI